MLIRSYVALAFAVASYSLPLPASAASHPAPAPSSTCASSPSPRESEPADHRAVVDAYRKLPLAFEANAGQYDAGVDFLARGSGYSLWLTPAEAVFALRSPSDKATAAPRTLRMQLRGGNPHSTPRGEDRLAGIVNHFKGSDPAKWHTQVPTFARVRYESVYPGIDLVYYGNQQQLEYDFVVAPGADPSTIALQFPGAESVRLDKDGGLVLGLAGRELRWSPPVVYQTLDGKRAPVAGAYRLMAKARGKAPGVGFTVADYDRTHPLVIDPVLGYSTYLGGDVNDHAFSVAVDEPGFAYVTGFTESTNFPVLNAAQAAFGGSQDAFVTKLDPTGAALVYSTYLGGSGYEVGRGITLDAGRNAYVTGSTSSTNFPVTAGAYDMVHNGNADVFVAKLNVSGALDYATYVGSPGNEQGEDIAVEGGRAYVVGQTESSAFPTTVNAYDTVYNGGAWDAFVFRLGPAGAALGYSTFLGGLAFDYGYGIALSGDEAIVVGYTTSSNFPTLAGYDMTYNNGGDAYVTRLAGNGQALIASTYLGGTNGDAAEDVALGDGGHVFLTGWTSSTAYPTTAGAYDVTQNGGVDAFVTKLNGALATLTYSTYVGGDGYDTGHGIAINSFSGAFVTGYTTSTNFPTVNPTQAAFGGGLYDAFVLRVAPPGDALNFSTFLGGPSSDYGYEIALNGCGHPVAVGKTADGFPTTPGAFDTTWNGDGDAFVTKIEP